MSSAPVEPRAASASRPPVRLIVGALLVVCLIAVLGFFGPRLLGSSQDASPDRRSALVTSIEDMGELKSATANLQVIVELANESRLPDWIRGTRTLFIAVGSVDATVDLRAIKPEDIQVSDDGRTARIVLPKATLSPARLDPQQSRIYDTDRGLVDRLEEAFGSTPPDQQQVYVTATQRLDQAAASDPDLKARAEQNAINTLTSMLRGLGFENVDISIVDGGSAVQQGDS